MEGAMEGRRRRDRRRRDRRCRPRRRCHHRCRPRRPWSRRRRRRRCPLRRRPRHGGYHPSSPPICLLHHEPRATVCLAAEMAIASTVVGTPDPYWEASRPPLGLPQRALRAPQTVRRACLPPFGGVPCDARRARRRTETDGSCSRHAAGRCGRAAAARRLQAAAVAVQPCRRTHAALAAARRVAEARAFGHAEWAAAPMRHRSSLVSASPPAASGHCDQRESVLTCCRVTWAASAAVSVSVSVAVAMGCCRRPPPTPRLRTFATRRRPPHLTTHPRQSSGAQACRQRCYPLQRHCPLQRRWLLERAVSPWRLALASGWRWRLHPASRAPRARPCRAPETGS